MQNEQDQDNILQRDDITNVKEINFKKSQNSDQGRSNSDFKKLMMKTSLLRLRVKKLEMHNEKRSHT